MPSLPFAVVPTPLGTITADGAALASNPASHLGEFDTIGMTWKTISLNPGVVVGDIFGDFGAAKTINFFTVLAATAQPGTTVRLRLSSDNFGTTAFDTGPLTFINPSITRADGLYSCHIPLGSTQTYRYWLLSIANHTGAFEASALVMGQTVTPANFYAPGFKFGVKDLGSVTPTPYGVVDAQPGRKFRTLDFTLGWTSESDFETLFRPLRETIGNTTPAFWCFDATANIYRQNRSYFGWLQGAVEAQQIVNSTSGPRFSQDFSILSMV